jgi:SAM-dependent methyltransferase
MLRFAAEKADRGGLAAVFELRRMDAEALDVPDGSFDVVLSLYSLLHFPHPLRALTEMRRVLRAGGRLVVGIGGPPALASPRWLIQAFRSAVDRLHRAQGKLLVGPGFLESLVERRLPGRRELEESSLASHPHLRARALAPLLRRAGFKPIRRDWLGHRFEFDDPEQFWEVQRTFSSVARKRLGDAPPEAVEAIRGEFIDACRSVEARGGALVYPVGAYYVTARR